MKRGKITILNFHPEPLSKKLTRQIEEELGRIVVEINVNFSINTMKYTYAQVLTILDKLNIKELPTDVVFHLPGLPTGALYLVIDYYARTGMFPIILELVRDSKKRKDWVFGQLRDLNLEITTTSQNPKRSFHNAIPDREGKKSIEDEI